MAWQVETIVQRPSLVGEGAIWDSQRQVLYWVDIIGHKLFVYDPASGENRTIDTLQAVGTVVPRAAGGLVVALHNGFASLDPDTGLMHPIADPERDIPANRFNDGKCDPAGRLWAGTMEFDGTPGRGALYCLELDGSVTRKFGGVSISNGIVWSRDQRTMYYVDTGRNDVRAYDYDLDSGAIGNERVTVTNAGSGHFDGMTMDRGGHAVDRHLRRRRSTPLPPRERRAAGGRRVADEPSHLVRLRRPRPHRPVHHLRLPAPERGGTGGGTAGRLPGKGGPGLAWPARHPLRRLALAAITLGRGP